MQKPPRISYNLINGPKTSITCFYKHLPPYPAFLNSACFMSPEVNPATCSNPWSHHKRVNGRRLGTKRSRLSPLLLSRTKLKLMSKFGKWMPERLFHGAYLLMMGAGSLHCEVTGAANNALLNSRPEDSNAFKVDSSNPGFTAQHTSTLVIPSFLLSTLN